MDMQLLFLPEEIAKTGQALAQDGGHLGTLAQQTAQLAASVAANWQGKAAGLYLQRLNRAAGNAGTLSSRLAELGGQLEQVSGIYRQGEQKAAETSEGLPVDGVFQV